MTKTTKPLEAGEAGELGGAQGAKKQQIHCSQFPSNQQEPCPFCGSELHQKIIIIYTPSAEMLALMRQIATSLGNIAWELSDKEGM